MSAVTKKDLVAQLQSQILEMQGLKMPMDEHISFGLGAMELAFPNRTFPTGVIHEFMSTAAEDGAATLGFMSCLLGKLMEQAGPCLWIAGKRTLFPPALKVFGIDPARIIFIDIARPKDILWTVEEALKCDGLSAVVGEIAEINFTASRRLQLAAEQSRVTGLMHCYNPAKIGNTTSVARWKITPLSSGLRKGMPGVGYPCWNVELARIRNGKPDKWQLQWSGNAFRQIHSQTEPSKTFLEKTG